MPIKRARPAAVALAELTFQERFAFVGCWWRPGASIRGAADMRCRTWREYFDLYLAVRSELLAARKYHVPPFAELALPMFEADPEHFDPDAAGAAYDRARTAYINRTRAGKDVA